MPTSRVGAALRRRRGGHPRSKRGIGAPVSVAYVLGLAVTTLLGRASGPEGARRMKMDASTDVDHLRAAPVRALSTSAFVIDGPLELLQIALVASTLVPLERRIGAVRTAALFAVGHVGATLATELPIALAISRRRLPESSAHRIDVGPSFGVFAALGAGCSQLPRPIRPWVLLGLLTGQALVDVANGDAVSGVGHTIALGIGVSSWPLMPASR
ncbi:MAG: hypothetical protein JWL73_446 [Actinomycetia bacterium]|nr:hypothetical protein [Actinomycetes bacterium]